MFIPLVWGSRYFEYLDVKVNVKDDDICFEIFFLLYPFWGIWRNAHTKCEVMKKKPWG